MFTKTTRCPAGPLLLLSELIHPNLLLPPSNQTTKEDSRTAVSMSTSAESQANVAAMQTIRGRSFQDERRSALFGDGRRQPPFEPRACCVGSPWISTTRQSSSSRRNAEDPRTKLPGRTSELSAMDRTNPSNRSFVSTTDQFLATCIRRVMQSLHSTTCTRTRLASHELV
jgi:hypothetical protein